MNVKLRLAWGCILIAFLLGMIWLIRLPTNVISPGVTVGALDLGGYSYQEAKELLAKHESELAQVSVGISYQQQEWQFTIAELGFYLDEDQLTDQAIAIGRQGSWLDQIGVRIQTRLSGRELVLEWQVAEEQWLATTSILGEGINIPAEDAIIGVEGNNISIKPHQLGRTMDLDQLQEDIKLALDTKEVAGESRPDGKLEVVVISVAVEPEQTTQEIQSWGINTLLAKYTTKFETSSTNRAHNIKTAAQNLESYLLPPGESFSFNQATGPKTAATGYLEAPVIVDNQLTAGIGGGVCQVSSTLYNSALLANLTILERRRHSLVVSYVPVGTDATVVDDYIDLRFKNNTSSYLLINTYVDEGSLTVRIFGNSEDKKQIEVQSIIEKVIEPKVVTKPDSSLAPGEEQLVLKGSPGYQTKVVRILREAGQILEQEEISADIYPPEDRVIHYGP